MILAVGSELLGYRIVAVLGRGGMGIVYLADDLRLKRRVALKVLTPELAGDERFRERLLQESELAASLDHPNIVPIYEAGEVDGQIFMSMRFVDGMDLKQRLRDGPLAPAEALQVASQVAAALDAAHAHGLVHGDVKPSNVLIAPETGHGGIDHVYLADFGLTRHLSQPIGEQDHGPLLGTLDYVAPEQIRGEPVDGRADAYSLGCLLYECLTGTPPFPRASDAAVLYAHLEEPPPSVLGLERVFAKALAKAPADRYGSCREFIESAREATGIGGPHRRRRMLALAVAAALVVFVGAGLAALTADGTPAAALAGRLVAVDAGSNRVVASARVGAGPQAVTVESGRVWVVSYTDGSLWQFDPSTGRAIKVPTGGRPFGLTSSRGAVYVAADSVEQFGGTISVFDAVTTDHQGGKNLLACSLTSGAYGLWVAGCPNVQQLTTNGGNPTIARTVTIPFAQPLSAANQREALVGMAEGFGSVWVVGDAADQRLWRIDPQRGRIVATVTLSFPPAAIATGAGAVWVTDELDDRIARIDPLTNRVDGIFPAGRGALGTAVAYGSVWVADAIAHALTRIDPRTGATIATIPLHEAPRAVTAGAGRVWAVGDAR